MRSFFSSVLGARLRWQDLPGSGTPVVFIHGLGCASSYEYPRIVTDPAFGGRRAILIDLPGSGYSERPEDFSYRTTDQARVVIELLDHLAIELFCLYGHSMGGSIAIEVASRIPSRIQRLAVSEPNFHAGGGQFSREIASETQADFVRSGYATMLQQEQSAWAGSLQSNAPWAVWRGANSLVAGIDPSWMTLFKAFAGQKALIFGERSMPDSDADAVRAADIPVHIVANAGHSMSWENPRGLAEAITSIFNKTA